MQLPLLARAAPHARVVGIAIGGGELPELLQFGQQLAEVLKALPDGRCCSFPATCTTSARTPKRGGWIGWRSAR